MRHGTAVAGVAAAGYVAGAPMMGVAPEALIGAYQVGWLQPQLLQLRFKHDVLDQCARQCLRKASCSGTEVAARLYHISSLSASDWHQPGAGTSQALLTAIQP